MGLCKCVKRTLTNQFCFEHRVNVCENCMVAEHPKCVVRSYLQWLNDSDYNPVCQLCQEELVSADCVRLVCYDIFHKVCLDDWAKKFPSNTAPAGYRCPVCSSQIFPNPNLVSPVADELRNVLSSFDWARIGLGMPLVKSDVPQLSNGQLVKSDAFGKLIGTHQNNIHLARGIPDGHDPTVSSDAPSEEFHGPLSSSQHRSAASVVAGISRKHSDSSTVYMNGSEDDIGENKYKRRPALEWFNRWLRTFHRPSSRHHQRILGGHRWMGIFTAMLIVFVIITILSYLGRDVSDSDPMLDPFNNPNIRIQEE